MGTGVRAEIQVTSAARCAVADLADGAAVRSVTRAEGDGEGTTVTEFVADGPVEGAEKVFEFGTDTVYRVTDDGQPCVCERVERLGYPVREHRVEDGAVVLAFIVPDIHALRSVVEALSVDGRRVSIRRLTQSGGSDDGDLVFVDRGALTDRQEQVLRTAERLGYFEHPREANAGAVAEELGISTSTFAEHLAAAQRKLFEAVLD